MGKCPIEKKKMGCHQWNDRIANPTGIPLSKDYVVMNQKSCIASSLWWNHPRCFATFSRWESQQIEKASISKSNNNWKHLSLSSIVNVVTSCLAVRQQIKSQYGCGRAGLKAQVLAMGQEEDVGKWWTYGWSSWILFVRYTSKKFPQTDPRFIVHPSRSATSCAAGCYATTIVTS